MDLAITDIYDAVTAGFRTIVLDGFTTDQVFDGPQVDYVGTEGVAVGATVDDTRGTFELPRLNLRSAQGESGSFPNLIWSGSGDVTFTERRLRVKAIFGALATWLAANRKLGDLVATSWIEGGEMDQLQTGRGALVTCEFRVAYTRLI
jgi:hypothetical protein